MKKAILLATTFPDPKYWKLDAKDAQYSTTHTDLTTDEWNNLSQNCLLPGVGIYLNRDLNKTPFVYLIIKGITYDSPTEKYKVARKFIKDSNSESQLLQNRLPESKRRFLFSAMESEKLLEILNEIDEASHPKEWLDLIRNSGTENPDVYVWKDYIGKYFLEIEEKALSNNDFENRVFELLCALGFEVGQKGHTTSGRRSNGIASLGDCVIVYDCKNIDNFSIEADDDRAIKEYVDAEKRIRSKSNIYGVFIAKSCIPKVWNGIFYFPIRSLLYLLYRKLILGSGFDLARFIRFLNLENYIPLKESEIDKEW